jgi:hypothetical protein
MAVSEKSEIYVTFVQNFSSHCAVNTSVSVIKTSQLMLHRETIALCSEIHTKHINAVCGPGTEFFIFVADYNSIIIIYMLNAKLKIIIF